MAINYNETWIGLLGGGVSGSIIGGGSIYQFDLWNMGDNPLPARVIVTGKRVGAVIEVGIAHAMLIVTGCKTAMDMDGITSSGLDWELAVGLKGSALVKSGSKLFEMVAAEVASGTLNWASHESTKRLVQWAMDDLGVVEPGKQFNLLPSPMSLSAGAGIFYDWQKIQLLAGNVGWQHISPKWSVESVNRAIRLQMFNIPEQDGKKILVGISVPSWGADPYIRWDRKNGETKINTSHKYEIEGYVYGGRLYEKQGGFGAPGINLSNLRPIGYLENGIFSVSRNDNVKKGGRLRIRPTVFQFSNYPYWTARESVDMTLDSEGCFVGAIGGQVVRS